MSQPTVKKIESEQEKFAPDRVDLAPQAQADRGPVQNVEPRSNVTDEQFPTEGLQAKTEDDKLLDARLSLANEKGETRFGKQVYDDKWAKLLIEKQKAQELAQFQAWFAKNFDRMSPAQKQWARERYPEFYAQRQKLVHKQAENLVKLADLKINGVKSFDDLMTQYLAETGRLDIGAVKHLLNPEEDSRNARRGVNEAAFKRGLFSPFRVFGEEAIGADGRQDVSSRITSINAFEKRRHANADARYGLDGGRGMPAGATTDDRFGAWYQRLAGVGQ